MTDAIGVVGERLAEARAVALSLACPDNLDGGLDADTIGWTLNVIVELLNQAEKALPPSGPIELTEVT